MDHVGRGVLDAPGPPDRQSDIRRELGSQRDDNPGHLGHGVGDRQAGGQHIRRRKKSLPLLLALRKRRMASAQLYKLHSLGADLSADQERDVVTLLNRCDAAAGAEHRAEAQPAAS